MYRRDYIIRLIERFGKTLLALRNRLLGLQPAGRSHAEAIEEIGEIARQAGLDLDIARRLDPAMLLAWLAPTDDVDSGRLWLMGELLYLTGLELRAAGQPQWQAEVERAHALFARLEPDWRPADDHAPAGARATETRRVLDGGDPG
jgi:hypothetical protein